MTRYLAIIEEAEGNWSAWLPDVPGCVAAGATREEALAALGEALAMHLEGLAEDGLPPPRSSASAEYLAPAGG